MTPLQTCLKEADELIGPSKRSLFDPVRIYVDMAEGHELRRVFILTDAAVRIIAPMALERDVPEQAAILRALPEIVDRETAGAARAAANAAYVVVDAAYDAAYADAYDVVNGAYDAANAAAYNAHLAAAYNAAYYANHAAYNAHLAAAYNAAYSYHDAAFYAAKVVHQAARVTRDDRPWLALRDAMLRAACLDGACCIHPECRGKDEEGVEGCSLMYPEFGRACLIEADPLGVRRNPTEMSTGTAALAAAAVGAVLGGLLYMLMPKNVSKESA